MNLENEIYEFYKHKSYSNARFILSSLMVSTKKYNIIMQILEFETNSFAKSIQFCTGTYTSLYFEALAFKKLKDYKSSISALKKILENQETPEIYFNSNLDFLILNRKVEIINELIGEIYQLIYEPETAYKHFCSAFNTNILMKNSFFKINRKCEEFKLEDKIVLPHLKTELDFLTEKLEIPYCNLEMKENNIFNNFDQKLYLEMKEEVLVNFTDPTELIKLFYKDISEQTNYEKYLKLPIFGTYFLEEYALQLSEENKLEQSGEIFEKILKKEKIFISKMDIYSSILYKEKNMTRLSNLSRKLLKYYFNHPISYAVLGNYYSLMNDHCKAINLFSRSLCLNLDFYTLNLIGNEYIFKEEYETAKHYFSNSLLLEKNNYIAWMGLGISYFNTLQTTTGIFYIKKAIQLVPKNTFVKYVLVKQTLKLEMYEDCLDVIESAFDHKSKRNRLDSIFVHINTHRHIWDEYQELIIVKLAELALKMRMFGQSKKFLSLVNENIKGYKSVNFELMMLENKEIEG